jgi:DNA polymerase V
MSSLLPFYLHKAGAGFPSPATDYVEEDVDLNIHLIKNAPATFIIRAQGKSMSNVGIYDGDLLIVDKSLRPRNLSIVIANVNDELVVKSFIKEKNLQFLSSGSKNLDDKIFINLNSDIFIWGVVTYVIHSTY